jgi:hypothetical protein
MLFLSRSVPFRLAILLLLVAGMFHGPKSLAAAQVPIRVSDNGRFLQFEDGSPFFFMPCTAWDLFHRLTREETDQYLENRAQKRFNAILAVVTSATLALSSTNVYGAAPFLSNNVATPNEAFFQHVDYVVNRAEALGLYVALLPVWGRDVVDTSAVNTNNAEGYGMFLGARYANKPIIWVLGGDRIGTNRMDVWRRLATGIAKGVTGGVDDQDAVLMTYHSATDSGWYHDEVWLDFNNLQSGHGQLYSASYNLVGNLYAKIPAKPVLDMEPNYEDIPIGFNESNGRFDEVQVRRQGYWGVFAGAFGYTYGASAVFQFYKPGDFVFFGARYPWYDAIDFPGATDVMHLRELMESRPFLSRRPDQSIIVSSIPSGAGHQRATRDTNSTYAMVYLPTGLPATINMTKIAGTNVNAWWFNPREGGATFIGAYTNLGNIAFTPPSTNDWVLVLDDASKNYPPPGTFAAPGAVSLTVTNDELVLSWDQPLSPLRLETTPVFNPAALVPQWSGAAGITNVNGNTVEVRLPVAGDRGFFRLRLP